MYEENSLEFEKEYNLIKEQARIDVIKEFFQSNLTLIPFTEVDKNGNSIFYFNFVKTTKDEIIDRIIKRDIYTSSVEFDPVDKKIIKTYCNCPDCEIKRTEDESYECKHIEKMREVIEIILNGN